MTSVILHGALGKKFGTNHKYMIRKPIDAVRALMANRKGFKSALKTWGKQGKLYEIICDGKKIESENELKEHSNIEQIDISSLIIGTSSNAAKIIVGIVMVVVSIYMPGAGGMLAAGIQGAGVSLIIGGIMGLLFPPPVPSFTAEAQSKSFIFSTLENSATQGVSVPLGYGRMRIGTKVISTEIKPRRMGDETQISQGAGWGSSGADGWLGAILAVMEEIYG